MSKETNEIKQTPKWLRPFGSKAGFIVYIIAWGLFILYLTVAILQITGTIQIQGVELSSWQKASYIPLIVGMLVLAHVPMFCRLVFKWRMPFYLDIYAVAGGFGHAAGNIFKFYDNLTWNSVFGWDKVLHFVGGAGWTLIGFSFILLFIGNCDCIRKRQISAFFVALFAFAFSMTAAVIWEFFEFFWDTVVGGNMQRWADNPYQTFGKATPGSGLLDTMLDLIYHAAGALPAAIIGGVLVNRRPDDLRLFVVREKDWQEYQSNKAEEKRQKEQEHERPDTTTPEQQDLPIDTNVVNESEPLP